MLYRLSYPATLQSIIDTRIAVLSSCPAGKIRVFCTASARAAALRGELLRAIPLEDMIEKGLAGIVGTLRSDLPTATEPELHVTTDEMVEREISRWLSLLQTDESIGATLDALVEDTVRRSALQAQIMSAAIVREVLGNMTDEKLNAIVYEKVEPDLLWIRMNGSIVGAAVGLILFLMGAAAKAFI